MSQNNRGNTPDKDQTGEVISWIIIFVLMFALPPLGVLLLIMKLRGYAKPSRTAGRQQGAQHYGAQSSNSTYRSGTYQQGAQRNNTNQKGAQAATGGAQQTGAMALPASTDSSTSTASSASTTSSGDAQQTGTQASSGDAQQTGTQQNTQQGASFYSTRQANTSRGSTTSSRQPSRDVETSVRDTVREIEAVAREIASEFGGIARDVKSQYAGAAKQIKSDIRAGFAQEYPPQTEKQTKKAKKKKRTQLEKKTGKFIATIILLISIFLFIIGANTLAGAIRDFPPEGISRWAEFGLGAFYILCGFIAFFTRNIGVKRLTRYKKYYTFIAGRDMVSMTDIARATGQSARVTARDIQVMINEGYLGAEAFIDSEFDYLFLSAEAAETARRTARAVQDIPVASDVKPENQYMAILNELRELNDTIVDFTISERIDRIELLTAKIFRIVEDDPEKLPQIRRFMSYYLPTTLKLLRSYATLEKQDIQGENITAAKESIERILDTLATGFEQQLDQLFHADAIDIAADINVLENLMQQDGLTGDKPEMKVMEGSS